MYHKKFYEFKVIATPFVAETLQVIQPADVLEYVEQAIKKDDVLYKENFWIIIMNRQNEVSGHQLISSGGISTTIVDSKILFKYALDVGASGIILLHNHPSGHSKPSLTDMRLTKKVVLAAALLDIEVLDHLIVTDHHTYSFKSEDLMPDPKELLKQFNELS